MPQPHRVLIAGGGVAGLEALIALHHLAGDRVSTTMITPDDEFVLRALSVEDPFALPSPRRFDASRICADHDATLLHDRLRSVDREHRVVTTESGEELPYDSLLVAIGARSSPVFANALTFRGLEDAEAMHGLIQDVEMGYVKSIAFVVPRGTTWPLPLYELALMTAERAESMCMDVDLSIVTPESAPLGMFGIEASRRVDDLLAERGIAIRSSLDASPQRIVALPILDGPNVVGLPADPAGFLPVDEHSRVSGSSDVFGAGDGTTNPVKQGGIAAQQALAAATTIAARAGAPVEPEPFRHVLGGELLTGNGSVPLGEPSPAKVAAPHLLSYLGKVTA